MSCGIFCAKRAGLLSFGTDEGRIPQKISNSNIHDTAQCFCFGLFHVLCLFELIRDQLRHGNKVTQAVSVKIFVPGDALNTGMQTYRIIEIRIVIK